MNSRFSCLLDCNVEIPGDNIGENNRKSPFQLLKNKLGPKKRGIVELKGKLSKIAGNDKFGFNNSNIGKSTFHYPFFLKYNQVTEKLFISEHYNHILRSIKTIFMFHDDSDGCDSELEVEVGQPGKKKFSNDDRNLFRLSFPSGFDWDKNDNMYVCNETYICKVDSKSNQVSLVAGHATDKGYKDGNNDEARFNGLSGILCHQQNHHQSPLELYVCDIWGYCIRMIDVTNDKTTTFAGKGKEYGDVDGTLQSTRFYCPWDIVKDDENDHILYVSDSGNHKIKMIDMKKGMVTTLVGDKKDESIICVPRQMQTIDSFIYVACYGFKDCIVRIDKHSKQVTKMKFNDGKEVSSFTHGIAYHELDQCFYISDKYNIYKLE